MGKLLAGHLSRIMLAATLVYFGLASSIAAPDLMLVLNGLLLSVSAGVAVAYAPIMGAALGNPAPSRGEYLVVGIFLSWLAAFVYRVVSIIARDLGHPEIFNTHATTFIVALTLVGGLFHLWAPNAVEGRLPRKRWVTTGIVVAVGLFVIFGSWTMHRSVLVHPAVELR